MIIRKELYLREEDKPKLRGSQPLPLWMPAGIKCKTSGSAIARELVNAEGVVCLGCELGPCALPKGVEPDRMLRIRKEQVHG
ncbi:MAG: hypothetical protein AB7E51_00380 [Pseudodesulfovibrio sp.]|uniref:hypothetical protein n=1 Tax=Pseudodesulfovibrio sp. TaxID=2035812 RepID=UPI003D0A27B1